MVHFPDQAAATVFEGAPLQSDVVSREGWKALFGSALGYAMDGFDLLILGFMLRLVSADLGLDPTQGASLVTATLIGAVVGGVVFGILSDRLGRVRVLTWTILLFAIFTGLCALSQGYWDLLFYRTMSGVGLGGEFGIGMALVAEAWPASKRARASSYVGLGWQMGVLAAAILTPLLLPVIGWRGMFAGRAVSRRGRLLHPPRPARAGGVRRQHDPPLREIRPRPAGGGRGDHAHQHRPGDPLLGAEFRLLRRHDLAALIPVEPVRLRPHAIRGVDGGHHRRHGHRHLRLRPGRRPLRPQAGVFHLDARRGHHGGRVFPADRPGVAADRRRGDGLLRQRHARRLRRADERAVSHRRPRHRAERAVQHRPRHRRLRPGRSSADWRPRSASTSRSRCWRCSICSTSWRCCC